MDSRLKYDRVLGYFLIRLKHERFLAGKLKIKKLSDYTSFIIMYNIAVKE